MLRGSCCQVGCTSLRTRRRLVWLMALVAALLMCVLPQVASAEPELTTGPGASTELGASTGPEEISLTPSTTKPYFACPHEECLAINEPPAIKTSAGYALPDGTPLVGGGPKGGYTPEELESAYNIPKSGGKEPEQQTVAVIDAYYDTTAESDLAEYRKEYKLGECKQSNGCFTWVTEGGQKVNAEEEGFLTSEGWGIETSLDLDMVSAACPECHIMLVQADMKGMPYLALSVNEAVKLGATEVSNSYGFPEDYEPWCGTTGCAQYNSDYDHPEYDGHPVVITAGAGDYGYDNHTFCSYFECSREVSLPSFPATSPDVIAVGGTALHIEKNARTSETVWPETGSGCSAFETTKTTGQKETEEKEGRKGCLSDRTDNDVAADASCVTPVSFYSTPGFKGWWYECGTSAASPFVAGIEAHANRYTRSLGANAFYKRPSMLFHVSEGSNGECGTESESTWYLCHATKEGYNGPTGMGTPDGVFDAAPPSATTGSATSVTETGATLNGTVNPNRLETKYYFEYGTTESYGSKTVEASAGSGESNVEESKAITSLTLGKQYDFRIVATNSSKETTYGSNQVFTPSGKPTVETKAATSIGETGVTLNGLVNPKGAETKYYFEYGTAESYGTKTAEVSAGSGISNVEESKAITGLTASTTYDFRIVATNTHGTTDGSNQVFSTTSWLVQEPPVPTGAKYSSLDGVSCTASTACTATGYFENSSGKEVPLAERWNGTSWTVQEPPNPTGATKSTLKGVSCTSSTACTATGYFENSSGKEVPLAERWNGTSWTVQEPPNPTGATKSVLGDVSCTSSTACMAVGYFENSSKMWVALAESWNGTAWSVQEPPSPTGAKVEVVLEGVSCTSSTACTAMGHFKNSANTIVSLAERWNGTSWTVQEPPSPTGATFTFLKGVSCTSATACTAVGLFQNSSNKEAPLAESWNGTAWSIQEPPIPTGAEDGDQLGVSCTSSTACIGVGSFYNSSKTPKTGPLAESWNGTAWSLQEPPSPTGTTTGDLWRVSCTSSTACVAVGYSVNSSGVTVPLAEDYH